MTTSSRGKTPAQLKSDISKLKKAGLYSGDLRKAPTDYAKRLTRRYADVISGHAQVVKVPGRVSESRDIAKHLVAEYSATMRRAGGKVIVKSLGPKNKQKSFYSKEYETIVTTVFHGDVETNQVYLRNAGFKLNREKLDFELANVPDLKDYQRYALPFVRNGRVGYGYYATKQQLMDAVLKYEQNAKEANENILDYVQIVHYGKLPKKSKRAKNIVKLRRRK